MLTRITTKKQGVHALDEVEILFVASSIGCALACLDAREYPDGVAGMVLLDAIIANSKFV